MTERIDDITIGATVYKQTVSELLSGTVIEGEYPTLPTSDKICVKVASDDNGLDVWKIKDVLTENEVYSSA